MDQAVFSFSQELYELKYMLECIFNDWRRASSRGAKEAALNEARMEVASEPWLRSLLPEWLSLFTSSPECQPQASNPFLGSRLAPEGPRSLQKASKRHKARLPARAQTAMVPAHSSSPCPVGGPAHSGPLRPPVSRQRPR